MKPTPPASPTATHHATPKIEERTHPARPQTPRVDHSEALEHVQQQGNAAAALNDISHTAGRDEMEINIRLARAPGNELHLDQLGAPTGTHLTTNTLAIGSQDSHVNMDRMGVLFNQANLGGQQNLSGQIGSTMGLLFGSIAQHTGSIAVQEYAGGIGQTRIVGASVTGQIGNVGIIGGATVVATGDTRLRVRTHHDNKYQMEYRDLIQVAGQMVGGVSSGHLGLGLRIGASKVRSVVYRSWVSPREAEQLTNKRNRFYDKLAVLRIRKPLMPLPNITDPLNENAALTKGGSMKVGDEIYLTYTGSLIGGVSVTGGGVYIGVHAALNGTHQLDIKKISEHEVELSIVPGQKSQAVGIGLDLPIAAEVHVSWSRSRATRHAYTFDLRDPQAYAAYLKAVDGELPGPLLEVEGYQVLGPDKAQRAVAQASLPSGVHYELLEQSATPFESAVGSTVTLPRLVPYANLAGLGKERRYRSEQSVVATRDVAVYERSTRKEKEVQNLNRGSSEVASYGSIKTLHRSDEAGPALGGVTVGVSFAADRTGRKNRNVILEKLQREGLIDKDVRPFADKSQDNKYEYEVRLERIISKGALTQTAPSGATPEEHAQQIQHEVTTKGPAGLAALTERFRSTSSQMRMSVTSAGPEVLTQKVVDLSATYQRPIELRSGGHSAIATRIKDVNKYLERIDKLRRDMRNDPILATLDPDNQKAQLASLDASEAALKRLVRLDHLGSNAKAYLVSQSSRVVRRILEDWKKKGML